MKKLLILLTTVLFISCQSEEITQVGSLTIPERFWGDWRGVQSGYEAHIEKHKITLQTRQGLEIVTEGETTVDNGTTHFEAELPNNEKLVLLLNNQNVLGITLYRDGVWVISEFYTEE